MENQETQVADTKTPIINGRMPVVLVYMVRFGNNKGEGTKTLANLFGTTVGKIDDIKKGRNFAYVTEDFKPTAEQKEQGLAWLKSHPAYDKFNVDAVVVELDSIPEATTEEAAAFEGVRSAARGQSPTKKDGTPADAGGGNHRPKREKKGAVADMPTEATGDALLA